MTNRQMRAIELFMEGYNCAQAVAMSFADAMGMEEKYCARLSSSFGGGMGRMREVCGAVSGMCLVLGVLYGYDDATDAEAKAAHYAAVQEICGEFRKRTGSIICRELLGLNGPQDPTPQPRTQQYYQKRPCADLVYDAAEILERYIREERESECN